MKINHIKWNINAWNEYNDWLIVDKKVLKRINELIKDTQRNPFGGLGKSEALKGNLTGLWSKMIDSKKRLIYKVGNDELIIMACKSHCRDN